MIALETDKQRAPSPHDDFLMILPVVERHARLSFRHWPAAHCEEAIAEAVAAALVNFVSLRRRGADPFRFPSMIAVRAVQRVRSDRHVGHRANGRDVLSRRARFRYGHRVESLSTAQWRDALADNTQTPVPDQVWFRCDVPAWLQTLKRRDRQIAILLGEGNSTGDVARRYRLSPARISQLRRELHHSWQSFQGELVTAAA